MRTYEQMKEHAEGMQRDYDLLLAEYNLLKQEPPPMECKTDAEKMAYAYGWFKALELNPARKLWVGLTDDERNLIGRSHAYVDMIIRAAEAKLKEKNT
jgi:hypothetical protein